MPRIPVHGNVDVAPVTAKEFDKIAAVHRELRGQYEFLPAPSPEHYCQYCPVDPHTVRYILVMLGNLRNEALGYAVNTPIDRPESAIVRFVTVNAIDAMLIAISAQFATEHDTKLLRSNYE